MNDPAHQRAFARVPLSVEVSFESDHNFYAGISDNISEGGIFVAVDDPPSAGTEVEFELALAGAQEKFRIKGVVRWVRTDRMSSEGMPPGCGIGWVDIPPRAVVAIHKFIVRRETLFYED